MIHDCNGRVLDGLILVDEDDAVSRVSVTMPEGWGKTLFVDSEFKGLRHAPIVAATPTLSTANKLNDSSFCQYRWRFAIPSVIDTTLKPEIEFVWVKYGTAVFEVTPVKNNVDSLKDAVKAKMPSTVKCDAPLLVVKDHSGTVLEVDWLLESNKKGTAYIVE